MTLDVNAGLIDQVWALMLEHVPARKRTETAAKLCEIIQQHDWKTKTEVYLVALEQDEYLLGQASYDLDGVTERETFEHELREFVGSKSELAAKSLTSKRLDRLWERFRLARV